MKRLGMLVSLVAITCAPSLARADEDDDSPPLPAPAPAPAPSGATDADTVHLRSGAMFRGRVSEIVPGDHVTVVVEGGGVKRIAWAEVDRVIMASTPIPRPAAASAPSSEAPPMVGPRARVHITSRKQVILYRRPAGTNSWTQACTSPCDAELPIGDGYRITGSGVAQSKEFHLQASPGGAVDVVVDPPSQGGMVVGGVMAYGGAATAYVGLLTALVGAAQAGEKCYSSSGYCADRKSDGEDLRDGGLVALGVGAAVGALGLVVFFNSVSTDITQRGAGAKDDARAASPRLDAFLRAPTWRGRGSSAEGAAAAPPATFPLVFGGHF